MELRSIFMICLVLARLVASKVRLVGSESTWEEEE